MKRLEEAQNKVTETVIALTAVSTRISKLLRNDTTVSIARGNIMHIGIALNEAAAALEVAVQDIIQGGDERINELVAEGRFD